jgi:pyruvate/oxaloacetate carboxyltransferase
MSGITGVETEIFDSQIPGGMISNMESQLRQQGAGDKLKEVLAEVPRVREVAGYPPLVTPSSQIVGTQAVFNVIMGPYKVLTAEFADLMLGYYGATLGERDPARSSSRPRPRPRRTRSRSARPTCWPRSGSACATRLTPCPAPTAVTRTC